MNCRLQDEVQSMCEGAEAWCAGNRKFWAAAVGPECVKTLSYRACFSPLLLDVVISRLFTTISAGNASERV